MLSQKQKNIIIETLKPYKPTLIGLFGSYARNEETENSDIDLLVDFNNSKLSLFDLMNMEDHLKEYLKKDVDLVTLPALKPYFKKYIVDDLIYLLNEENKQVIS